MSATEIRNDTELSKRICDFYKRWDFDDSLDLNNFKVRILNSVSYIINETSEFLHFSVEPRYYAMNDICENIAYELGFKFKRSTCDSFNNTYLYQEIDRLDLNNEKEFKKFLFIVECLLNNKSIKKANLSEKFAKEVAEIINITRQNIKIIKDDNVYKIIKCNEKYLDESLIIQNIEMLNLYKDSKEQFLSAITCDRNIMDNRSIVDKLRLSVECLFKQILGNNKSLENQKNQIGEYLKNNNVDVSIRNMYSTLLDYYLKYNNNNVKHGNNVDDVELNYIIYLTGTFIYLITQIELLNKTVK